jgi:PAS domain S-box-containing protein
MQPHCVQEGEEVLQYREAYLQAILETTNDAVVAVDPQGRITRLNPAAEKLTGWTQAEASGELVHEAFHLLNDATRQPDVIPVDAALDTRKIQTRQRYSILIARDGTERPVAVSAAPVLNTERNILGAVVIFRDVSKEQAVDQARLENETRYHTLFDSIDEGFCIIEMIFDDRQHPVDYRFLEINSSFEKQTGLSGAAGKRMLELAPQHEAHWFEIYGRVAMTGEAIRFQNAAEQLHRWYDVYAFRFGAPKNRQVAILFSDITRQKETEAEIAKLNVDLQRRTAELEAANLELGAFSYSVSHDLRAPLRHVQGYVDVLGNATEGQLSEQAQRYMKIIKDSSRQMGQLIDDLLAFSRMGQATMQETTVSMETIVRTVIHGLEMATSGRNIVWKIAELPQVIGDASLLKQVLVNLIGNAVKYSRHRDPAEIEIGCAGVEDGRTIFFVKDNGAGFDMEYVQKLFGVFQRLHRASEFEGTGIGLAIVRRIVTRHGGRAWAEGSVGQGATFYFTLRSSEENP